MEKLFKGTSVTAFRIHRTTCPPSDVLHSQIGAWGGGDMERGKEEGRGWTEGCLEQHLERKKMCNFPLEFREGFILESHSVSQSLIHVFV